MKRSFTPRQSDSLLLGAVSRGDNGQFISVQEIVVANVCDDECGDGETYFDVSVLNARHPNGAYYMAHLESAEERTTRLLAPAENDLRGMELHLLSADDLMACADGDPLQFAILREEAALSLNTAIEIERQRAAAAKERDRATHFQTLRRNRRALRQAAQA